MRKVIRATLAGGASRIAVVCGAWHAPALVPEAFPSASADNARLRGLPKLKVAATWVPWTSALLARRSGYGAGVDAPGWYRHLRHCARRRSHPVSRQGGPAVAGTGSRRQPRRRPSRPSGSPKGWPPCGAGPVPGSAR